MRSRVLLLVTCAALGACQSSRTTTTVAGLTENAPAVAGAPSTASEALFVEPYRGAFARDPVVVTFLREAPAQAAAAADRLQTAAGLSFLEGRGPRLRLVDDADAPALGQVDVRLVDGVRRPDIILRAASVASGELRVRDHLPALVAQAALLATSGERAPPDWLRTGVPLHFGGAMERRLDELAIGAAAPPGTPSAYAPLDGGFRAAALARIGEGDRPFLRYLEARLAGKDESAALRDVGVTRPEFLDAASETERDRALRALRDDPGLAALRAVRAQLDMGNVEAADALLGGTLRSAEGSGPAVVTDLLLVRAEIALRRKEAKAALSMLDDALLRPVPPVRLGHARFLRALAEAMLGDPVGVGGRNVDVLRWYAADPRAPQLAEALGVPFVSVVAATHAAPEARAAALEKIAPAKAPAAVVLLRRALRDGEPAVRLSAVKLLGASGDKSATADLQAAASDPDPAVRAAATAIVAPRPVAPPPPAQKTVAPPPRPAPTPAVTPKPAPQQPLPQPQPRPAPPARETPKPQPFTPAKEQPKPPDTGNQPPPKPTGPLPPPPKK